MSDRFFCTAIDAVSVSASKRGAAGASSSRPNPCSTFQETQASAPSVTSGPAPVFCTNTTTDPSPGIAMMYWVLTPLNETSMTRPGPRMLVPAAEAGSDR